MDELSRYEAICESYQSLPLSSLQVLRDLIEAEISARVAMFCNVGVGDVESVKTVKVVEKSVQISHYDVNKQSSRPTLSIVRK